MTTPAAWTFVLDSGIFGTGTPVGEVRNATDRQVSITFNKPSTASFTIRGDNPLVEALFGEDDCSLRVYQGTTLRFHGLVLSAEMSNEDGKFPTVKVTCVDPSWIWSKRIVGQQLTSPIEGKLRGYVGKTRSGDKGTVAKEIIEEACEPNTYGARDDHVKISGTYKSESTGTYTAGPFKTALSCINDLAHGTDGFDWIIKPIELNISGDDYQIGEYFAYPVLGEERANTIFEYGAGSVGNVRTMSYVRDMSTVVNRAFHLPEELTTEAEEPPVSPLIIQTYGQGSASASRRYYLEEVTDATGLVDEGLRKAWVEAVVDVRENPRQVLSMTCDYDDGTGRVPVYGTDFSVGDIVTARGRVGELTLFNGKVRIYQVNVSVNDNGTATVTPILVSEEGTL